MSRIASPDDGRNVPIAYNPGGTICRSIASASAARVRSAILAADFVIGSFRTRTEKGGPDILRTAPMPSSGRRAYFESFAAPVTASPADDTSRPTPSTVLHALMARAPATTARLKNFRIITSDMRRVYPLDRGMSGAAIRSGWATHRVSA